MEKSADGAEFWSRRDEAESGDEGEGSSAEDELLEMGQRVEGDDVVQEEVGEEIAIGLKRFGMTVCFRRMSICHLTLKDT